MSQNNTEIQNRLLRQLYENNVRGSVFNILTSAYVFLFFTLTMKHYKGMVLWLVVIVIFSVIRFILSHKAAQLVDSKKLQTYFPAMVWVIFINGLLWGLLYPLYFNEMTEFQRLFTTLILFAGATIAIMSLAPSKLCYYAFTLPLLLPVIMINLFNRSIDYYFFNAGIIIYLLMMFYLHHNHNSNMINNMRLLLRQEELISSLRQLNEKLSIASITDSLTNLYNRGHFSHSLKRDWSRCKRAQLPIALMFIDIDYFKEYNDTYGHLKGDHCLQSIAHILKQIITRETDLVARFGGDEMALILYNTDEAGAINIADKIMELVRSAHIEHIESPKKIVTLSIGLAATVPQPNEHEHQLLLQVDKALYEAKACGRDTIRYPSDR